MNTKNYLSILLLMLVPVLANAQKHIQDAFEKIEKSTSILPSVSTSEEHDSNGRAISETRYVGFKVGSLKNGLTNILQDAFEKDKGKAKTAFINTSPDAPRNHYQIVQKNSPAIILGNKPNSSYLILTFPDKDHPGYRFAYAAEWWDANDPDDTNINEGFLVVAYGETPKAQTGFSPSFNMGNILNVDTAFYRMLPDTSWVGNMERIRELPKMEWPGIVIKDGPSLHWDKDSQQFKMTQTDGKAQDLPSTGSKGEWMANAIDHVEHLSNKDWHRLFGLITQKMIDKDNTEDDLIVAAGIILQLCKNAESLDEDEKGVCIVRLKNIAENFNDTYVGDLLMLSARKLNNSRGTKP